MRDGVDRSGQGNVYLPVPRPAFHAVLAFSKVVNADVQIVFINAVKQHIDEHVGAFSDEDKRLFEQHLDQLEREESR